ncbi:MAG: A24 family peptidase [Planctomycetota bacterium]
MLPAWIDQLARSWLLLSTPVQYAVIVCAGVLGGALANHAITTWCWNARPISPWANWRAWIDPKREPNEEEVEAIGALERRKWTARLPIIGWLVRSDETTVFGAGFWIRPLLIELAVPVLFVLHYRYLLGGGLLPAPPALPVAVIAAVSPWMATIFVLHACFLVLMTAATFIDFDERTIPDRITVPGTLLALVAATLTPRVFLPGFAAGSLSPVLPPSPGTIADWWLGTASLPLGLAIWTVWCFALLDRRVILRKGLERAVAYFWARLFRSGSWRFILPMWLIGCVLITGVARSGGTGWLGLVTSLVGLAVGGGIVWGIRLVASGAMQMEAMGFGDVTLMAMLGAAVGWQAATIAFFLSPIAALFIVIVVWMITRDSQTPFGPYLCAGSILTVVFWDDLYNEYAVGVIAMFGPNLVWFALFLLSALGGMLFVWRLLKERFLLSSR